MEHSRRNFLGLAGAGALTAALAGCSSVLPAPDTTARGFGVDATGTVRLWCRSATQTGITQLVTSFNASQDRVRVELTPVLDAQYVTKLATAIRGGDVPDLVDIDDINSTLFVFRDAFTDLTDLIADLDYVDQLSPGHLALATLDDRQYGIPFLADNSLLFVNTELFDRAELDIDRSTSSFEGYIEAATAIRTLGDDVYGWSFPANSPGALGFVVQPMIWADDVDLIEGEVGEQRGNVKGNDTVKRVLEFFRQLWQDELVTPSSFSDDASRWGSEFRDGAVGIFPTNYQVAVGLAEGDFASRVDVRMMRGPDGGEAFFDGGDNMCIPRGAANASGAWQFVQYALDLEQQSELPAGGYEPVRADAATPEFREKYPLAVLPVENLDEGYAPSTLAYNLIYNQPDGPWLKMFRRAVFEGEVDAAMDEAQVGYDRILTQAQA